MLCSSLSCQAQYRCCGGRLEPALDDVKVLRKLSSLTWGGDEHGPPLIYIREYTGAFLLAHCLEKLLVEVKIASYSGNDLFVRVCIRAMFIE